MATRLDVSFIFPIHNEEAVLRESIDAVMNGLRTMDALGAWEIILVENGSTDRTFETAMSLRDDRIRSIRLPERALGAAIRRGIEAARFPFAFFYAIDLPFGLEVISASLAAASNADAVVGSKAHPASVVHAPIHRRAFSSLYRLLARTLLGLRTRDPQGSLLLRRAAVLPLLAACPATNAFFTTQLLLALERNGGRVVEIPIRYVAERRPSRFPMWEGVAAMKLLIAERRRLRSKSRP